jgi:hypothetical protein
METIIYRPLTETERRRLRKHASGLLGTIGPPLISGAFFFMLLSIPIMLIGRYVTPARPILPLLFAAAAAWVLYQAIIFFRGERNQSRLLRTDLREGSGEVRQYTAVDAVRVEEAEDEGTGFFVKLTDGRILFLVGQHFYELEEDRSFPCARFEYTRTPNSKWFLDFVCTGEHFPPSYSRGAFPRRDWKRGKVPRDGEVFVGDFEALKSQVWPLPNGTLERVG